MIRVIPLGLAFAAAFLASSDACAQPAPLTGEIQVNSYTSNDQELPSVCVGTDGTTIVVWESTNQLGVSGRDIFGQRLTGAGSPQGTEFQVNAYTTGNQDTPTVSCAGDNGFVVVWESGYQDGDGNGVFARRFSNAASPQTGDIQLNSFTTLDQGDPHVAIAPDGSFIAVWESLGQDGNNNGLFGARFLSNGSPGGAEFPVNSYATGAQQDARIARASDGNFVVVFEGNSQMGGAYRDVFLRRFDESGTALQAEVRANATFAGEQQNPDVDTSPGGGFVVAWQGAGQDGSGDAVRAQRFTNEATAVGPEFQVNAFTTGDQDAPSVAVGPDGGFMIAWESTLQDLSDDGIFARLYDEFGTPVGTEIQVAVSALGPQRDGAVAAFRDRAQFVWRDANGLDGGGGTILTRGFDRKPSAASTTTVPGDTTTTTTTTTITPPTSTSTTTVTTVPPTTTTLPANGSCGDPDGSGALTATDALSILQTAVGIRACALCICDVDSTGAVTATDALRVLRIAVGLPLELACQPC